MLFLSVIGMNLRTGEFEAFRQLHLFIPLNALWVGLIAFTFIWVRDSVRGSR